MKKTIFSCFFLLLVMALHAQFAFNGVVAHRGGIYDDPAIPENSLAALKKSIELGVYAVEIDVHLTKDNVPIVLHDHEMGGMNVELSSYADIKTLRLSNGEAVPTLDAFMRELMKDKRMRVWLDLKRSKQSPARDVLLAQYAASVVNSVYASRRTDVITPSFDALVRFRQIAPEARLLYIGVDKTPETLQLLGFEGINLQYKRYDKGEYNREEAKKYGLLVGAYVVDDPAEMKRQLDLGVNFITTNKPALLLELLKNYKPNH